MIDFRDIEIAMTKKAVYIIHPCIKPHVIRQLEDGTFVIEPLVNQTVPKPHHEVGLTLEKQAGLMENFHAN